MNIKSQILKQEFQKALKMKKETYSDFENERNKYSDEIKINLMNIKESLNRLRGYHESKRKLIAKIRNIMETPSNHEKDLIYNKLTEKKEEEYKREISNLNRLIKNDISKTEEYRINNERKIILDKKEKYIKNEKVSMDCTNEAIENGRKRIFELSIGFLENDKRNKENIKTLKKMLAEG